MKEMAGIIETSLSNFKQHMEDSASMHSQRINEELRKLRQIIRQDLEADLIERDKKIEDNGTTVREDSTNFTSDLT